MTNNNPGCLGYLFQLFGINLGGKTTTNTFEAFPYGIRDDFLSPSELSFYKILTQVIPNQFVICPKVSLKDIFFVTEKDRSKHQTYFNKISKKHVDFLICSAQSMKPVCGIELDDTSHARDDRIKRDEFVNRLYEEAGLKLIRFSNKKAYTISEVQEKVQSIVNYEQFVSTIRGTTSLGKLEDTNEVPKCPKCKSPFVLRTAKSGKNKGKQFYGCVNYPKCRETIDID